MHTIRVYAIKGGLCHTFTGPHAEKEMLDHFHGEPSPQYFMVLR